MDAADDCAKRAPSPPETAPSPAPRAHECVGVPETPETAPRGVPPCVRIKRAAHSRWSEALAAWRDARDRRALKAPVGGVAP